MSLFYTFEWLSSPRMQEHALVIHEEIVMRNILMRMLLQKGYACLAVSGLHELEHTDEVPFYQVVVSDLLFKGVSPTEFMVQLLRRLTFNKLFIVTALGQNKVKRSVFKLAPVHAYLEYPVNLEIIEKEL